LNHLIAYLPSPAFPRPQAGPSALSRLVERLITWAAQRHTNPAEQAEQAAALVEQARAYRDNQPSYQDDLLATAAAVTHPTAVH